MAGTPGTGAITQGRHEGPPAPRAGEDPDASPAPPVSQSANGSRASFNREPPWFRARLGAPGPWGKRLAPGGGARLLSHSRCWLKLVQGHRPPAPPSVSEFSSRFRARSLGSVRRDFGGGGAV